MLVETAEGPMMRLVPSASPLVSGESEGRAAEQATHRAAALWGLPDFVYGAEVVQVGSGVRELGDGIVIVGATAIVLQVKRRESISGKPERERNWILKSVETALSQASGTIRRLAQEAATLTSMRGRSIEIVGSDYQWISVVIIDHDDPPSEAAPLLKGEHPAVVMLRRDWEFLFDQLKSTAAVVEYCARVANEPIEIGAEPKRYYELAQADHNAPEEPIDPRLTVPGHPIISTPKLPLAPAASDDLDAHRMVRTVMEQIALTRLTVAQEKDVLRVLAELDRLPVASRTAFGRFLIDAITEAKNSTDDAIVWRYKSLRGNRGQVHLAFAACNKPFDRDIQDAFHLWVRLRHHEVVSVTGDHENLTTVGVLLTPRGSRARPWDTTMAAVCGDMGYSPGEVELIRELWPPPQPLEPSVVS
ncbi:MAG: hypothetical protein ACTHM1_09355 [Solirubrobacteraceae bacterium]